MIFGTPLTIELGEVVHEVGVDIAQEPGLPRDGELSHYKQVRGDPIDEDTSRPSMSERKVEELQHAEESPEPVDRPVLVLFSDATSEVHISEDRGDDR